MTYKKRWRAILAAAMALVIAGALIQAVTTEAAQAQTVTTGEPAPQFYVTPLQSKNKYMKIKVAVPFTSDAGWVTCQAEYALDKGDYYPNGLAKGAITRSSSTASIQTTGANPTNPAWCKITHYVLQKSVRVQYTKGNRVEMRGRSRIEGPVLTIFEMKTVFWKNPAWEIPDRNPHRPE